MSTSSSLAASTPLRVVIVDDEPAARRGVVLLLARHASVVVVAEAGSGGEAVAAIRRESPDVVFLDVQMPGGDGFEVLRQLQPGTLPVVVFVTAFDHYALKAFEVNAVDYLLKPYEDERFHAAVEHACGLARLRSAQSVEQRLARLLEFVERSPRGAGAAGEGSGASPEGYSDRILIKSSGEIHFLKVDEIDWIEAEGDYMKFHASGKSLLLRETMARLEARLDPRRFVRIHRSTIVNIDRVRKLSPTFIGEYAVVLNDGTKLKLSRGYHERLQELLKSSL